MRVSLVVSCVGDKPFGFFFRFSFFCQHAELICATASGNRDWNICRGWYFPEFSRERERSWRRRLRSGQSCRDVSRARCSHSNSVEELLNEFKYLTYPRRYIYIYICIARYFPFAHGLFFILFKSITAIISTKCTMYVDVCVVGFLFLLVSFYATFFIANFCCQFYPKRLLA